MISRAFFRLLPFLCLLVASANAKQNDTPSRRLSSLRRLKVKGMNNINVDDSASPPIVDDGWNDRTQMGNRHELRFLKKESDSDSSKTKTKTTKESTDGKKGKTKTSTTGTSSTLTPVSPILAPDEPEIAQAIASGTEDDDGLIS